MPDKTDQHQRMRPIVILPKDAMSRRDMNKLERNGICVVEASDPSLVRFAEPPPEGYSVQERAAIQLFRRLMRDRIYNINRQAFAEMYADIIVHGMPMEGIEKAKGA